MTDRDVIKRVATAFGTSVQANDKGRHRPEYGAVLKGSQAAALMIDLRPMMGNRRRRAINDALKGYLPPRFKLDFQKADEIRDRYAGGESVSSLSRAYGVARSTIRPILQRRIYSRPPPLPWREAVYLPQVPRPACNLSARELCWLAGWLEGEGSFLAPPPSDPRRPRISGTTRDLDVIAEVGRLLHIKPGRKMDRRAAARGWSPAWRILRQGKAAAALMDAIKPIMGERRSGQIDRALEAARPPSQDALALSQAS
jgi:hypothetical protein